MFTSDLILLNSSLARTKGTAAPLLLAFLDETLFCLWLATWGFLKRLSGVLACLLEENTTNRHDIHTRTAQERQEGADFTETRLCRCCTAVLTAHCSAGSLFHLHDVRCTNITDVELLTAFSFSFKMNMNRERWLLFMAIWMDSWLPFICRD